MAFPVYHPATVRLLFLALLFTVVACDTLVVCPEVSADGVSLRTDSLGDGVLATIGLVLRNESAETIETAGCAGVERRVEDVWTPDALSDRPCDLGAVVLEAGES
ncbi:hypothetical protein [Rubrivirga sp.]|uniref:hypothetical protein n=1 Tax=Rubrivirga sp. TaxID=1885344 RepID=UPI003C732E2B